jgi:hypothetical protein
MADSDDLRQDEAEGGGRSNVFALAGFAVLVALLAVLGLRLRAARAHETVAWATTPFESSVAVKRVLFDPDDATATITVDPAGWRGLAEADQQALAQRLATVAAPHGAKQIRVASPGGTPLATGNATSVRLMAPPPQPP